MRLPLEALQRQVVLGEMLGQELQSDEARELGVLGLVDHAHATGAQLLDDAVVRSSLANHAEGVQPLRVILRCSRTQVNQWADKLAGLPPNQSSQASHCSAEAILFWYKLQPTTSKWFVARARPVVNGCTSICCAKTIRTGGRNHRHGAAFPQYVGSVNLEECGILRGVWSASVVAPRGVALPGDARV